MTRAHLAHHFDDPQQQRDAATLGMWAFLATEVLFIGAMFTAYAVYRWRYPAAFAEGSRNLELWMGTLNTAILLTSSFTVALAVHAARVGRKKWLAAMLLMTLGLGGGFVVVKGFEYAAEYHRHLVPAFNFEFHGESPRQVELFMVFYFFITLVHATHLLIGLALLLWLFIKTTRNQFSVDYHTPVEVIGLYWHFVDIVWIFVFPLLYLIRS